MQWSYYEDNGSRYYYVETTAKGRETGQVADEFRFIPAKLIHLYDL